MASRANLSMYDEPLDEYIPLVARIEKTRPFLDLLAQNFGREAPIGLYTGWVKDSFIAGGISGGHWFHGADHATTHANVILSTGIPAAYSIPNALVTTLCGDSVTALKDHEIERILSSGVYMDAQALKRLNEMGYGDLTGFDIEQSIDHDCMEQLVEHSINGTFAGRNRNCRQSFWKGTASVLIKQDEKAEILARLVDYTYQETAPCCMGVYENHLGGRICVAGYYPWKNLQNLSKSCQIKALMRWLSRDSLPAYIDSFHRVNLWVREPENGKLTIALTNSYLDPAMELKLNLLTNGEEISVFDMDCLETKVRTDGTDGIYKQFTLSEVGPWQMAMIITHP